MVIEELQQNIDNHSGRLKRSNISLLTQIPRSVISRLTPAPSFPWTGRCIFDLQKPL